MTGNQYQGSQFDMDMSLGQMMMLEMIAF